jgi:hypothetical protein
MKIRRKVPATMLLIAALGSGLAGCTDKAVWRNSGQMCRAHGGSYSRETRQCTFATATTVSGKEACEDLAGIYMPDVQRCQFDE